MEVSMKIRRYLGNNAQEAILKVKMDLGNDALILSTRKVRPKGFFRVFAKPMVEVLAAIDDNNYSQKTQESLNDDKSIKTPSKEAVPKENLDEKEEKIINLENKVSSIEIMLKKMYEQLLVAGGKEKTEIKNPNQISNTKALQLFYQNLLKNEVEVEIAKQVIDLANKKIGEYSSVGDAALVLYNTLSEMLGEPETINLQGGEKPTTVIFVGPTGVGKTTTLAKIAANYTLNHKKDVGLITADTYRIAAVEQLKTYAEILGIPITVIYTPEEIKNAIGEYQDKDLILIDTAGRSYTNKGQFDELKELVKASNTSEVYLVISAATSMRTCREIIKQYSFLKQYKLIFTKTDETPVMGVIFNVRYLTGKRLSYITTGQNVPDDIEVVEVNKLAKNLLGSIT
jgi:flagellar biosynthesis protein FlhF